jgi:hypothetical protein
MMLKRIIEQLEALRAQWADNVRLRLGLLFIVAILWAYGLLVGADFLTDRQKLLASLSEQAVRLAPVAREQQWPARADEAKRQLTALQAMVWVESDLGLAEARFQDWLRATAGSSGLVLRELTLARVAAATAGTVPAASSASGAGRAGAAPQVITARVTAELKREALLGFLSELARSDRAVVVDRLMLRIATQPPVAEIDLRILARASGEAGK